MRLINTTEFFFQEFHDNRNLPKYAVLSHRWGEPENEVSFQAFRDASFNKSSYGWLKILQCCRIAKEEGLEWAWVDTCCINRESSTELMEAINSMFFWYELSHVCYVFLPDVGLGPEQPMRKPFLNYGAGQQACYDKDEFLDSIWFKRGWTLQELIAPSNVEFYNKDFAFIDTKRNLSHLVEQATGIEADYLKHEKDFRTASIAKRMHWASKRTTQRVEDAAYSLLGIFDVNMPLLYGEGDKAFFRLQRAISQRRPRKRTVGICCFKRHLQHTRRQYPNFTTLWDYQQRD